MLYLHVHINDYRFSNEMEPNHCLQH